MVTLACWSINAYFLPSSANNFFLELPKEGVLVCLYFFSSHSPIKTTVITSSMHFSAFCISSPVLAIFLLCHDSTPRKPFRVLNTQLHLGLRSHNLEIINFVLFLSKPMKWIIQSNIRKSALTISPLLKKVIKFHKSNST